ncbi:hypothetical protein TNCV_3557641 [Trichonephila clavipes]|uniref:Uncharacterized protein n=1 Tax=Trichonephila clavipes TaxID=2585209 RepID=A0A8X6WDK7_TRICX|nr:hypothetical protein TNCV_3557641 [Trichonephila clavipes]
MVPGSHCMSGNNVVAGCHGHTAGLSWCHGSILGVTVCCRQCHPIRSHQVWERCAKARLRRSRRFSCKCHLSDPLVPTPPHNTIRAANSRSTRLDDHPASIMPMILHLSSCDRCSHCLRKWRNGMSSSSLPLLTIQYTQTNFDYLFYTPWRMTLNALYRLRVMRNQAAFLIICISPLHVSYVVPSIHVHVASASQMDFLILQRDIPNSQKTCKETN